MKRRRRGWERRGKGREVRGKGKLSPKSFLSAGLVSGGVDSFVIKEW